MIQKHLAELTAKWWAKKLIETGRDNGDQSDVGFFTSMLASMEAAKNIPTEEQLEKFQLELVNRIMQYDNSDMELYLGCDYTPCQMLYDAAVIAGISIMCFPWKTHTRTLDDALFVSDGYRQPYIKIDTVKEGGVL